MCCCPSPHTDATHHSCVHISVLVIFCACERVPRTLKIGNFCPPQTPDRQSREVTPDSRSREVTPDGRSREVTPDGRSREVTPDGRSREVTPDSLER